MQKTAIQPQRYPRNAPGDFYSECVQQGDCNHCLLPQIEAPSLIGYVNGTPQNGQCYFKRQPQTPEELRQATNAIEMACCDSLRYSGHDPKIIAWLDGFNCDYA
jgi:hypothetical protein